MALRDFQKFKKENKSYPQLLSQRWKLLYRAYRLLPFGCFGRFFKKSYALACCFGFGLLMRHAMESIVVSAAPLHRLDPSEKSMATLLTLLEGKLPQEKILSKARRMTNSIAHPSLAKERPLSFSQFHGFYQASFKGALEAHLLLLKKSKQRKAYRYLFRIKKQMDRFSLAHRPTAALLRGCLVRQLTECAANFWCWQYAVLPTDASTEENPIELSGILTALAEIARGSKFHERVSHLFELKNLSNPLMHADSFHIKHLISHGKALRKCHSLIKAECCPRLLKRELKKQKKRL